MKVLGYNISYSFPWQCKSFWAWLVYKWNHGCRWFGLEIEEAK